MNLQRAAHEGMGPSSRSGFLVAFMVLSAVPGWAQAQTVTGVVLDSAMETRVPGASVTVYHGRRVLADLKSDTMGRFEIPLAPSFLYLLQVNALGYEPRTIRLREGMAPFSVLLKAQPLRVDGVQVTAQRRDPYLDITGFYQRERAEIGSFITPEQIEKRKPGRISDLFHGVSGIRIVCGQTPVGECRVATRRMNSVTTAVCFPAIYLDDVALERGRVDGLVQPQDLLAVEVYAGAARVPARYGGANSACGVVLLWTRLRS